MLRYSILKPENLVMRMITKTLTLAACAICVSACDSKAETLVITPPAADLRAAPEPQVPDAALEVDPVTFEPTSAAEAAEQAYHDSVLLWGRGLKLQIERVCRYVERTSGQEIGCPAAD